MPWNLTEQNIRGPIPVVPRTAGGYSRSLRPDPNDPMNAYRGSKPGMRGPDQFANGGNDTRTPISMTMLKQAADETDAADHQTVVDDVAQQHSEGRMDTIGRANADTMAKTALSMSSWTPFLQALKNKGANHLTTDFAARPGQARSDTPNFYDTQTPSMAGLQSAGQMQRQQQLNAFNANETAALRRR